MKLEIRRGKLDTLIEYLDGLTARATIDDLTERLDRLQITTDDLGAYVRFSEDSYRRNLVRLGRCYQLLVLCWRSGQRSPIHNHIGSTCGVRVLSGIATETIFERAPCSLLSPVRSHDLGEGMVAVSQDDDTHQVSNLQVPGTDLVTLHIYSPPLLRMETFSLTERTVGEFVPMVYETDGSGI